MRANVQGLRGSDLPRRLGSMIAALYVQTGGAYFGLPDVDPYDEQRDARTYAGPHAVVAHPPCSRWCQLAFVNQARYGHRVGDDGGCFRAALAAVCRWGGVLEHPAATHAWAAFSLPRPIRGRWAQDITGAWVAEVSQRAYGHRAQKLTWLYYVGAAPPPSLNWDRPPPAATVSFLTNHGGGSLPRLGKREACATPLPFRNLLLSIARGAR